MANILIVDDNVLNRILLNEIIEHLGFNYDEAENGQEALQKLEKGHFDAVLLDVEMPRMNGFEVVKHIRKKMKAPKSNIPVVAVTAHDPNSFMEDFKNSFFNSLVTKPYSQEKIRDVFQSLGIA